MRIQRFWLILLSILLQAVESGHVVYGQGGDVVLSGTVRDQTGAVLPGVAITVTETETGTTRTTTTQQDGRYNVVQLGPGTYQVQADLPGFSRVLTEPVKLSVGDRRAMDLVLPVGQQSEVVTVASGV